MAVPARSGGPAPLSCPLGRVPRAALPAASPLRPRARLLPDLLEARNRSRWLTLCGMCFDHDSRPPALPAERVLAPLAGGAGAEVLTLTSEDGTRFAAALAHTPLPSPVGVVIIPDVRGLYRFYAELAERFAEAGHTAIALDPFGRTAGAGERDEDFDYMPHVRQTRVEQVQADIAACTAALRERAGVRHAVVVGFCFGGAQAFHASTRDDIGLDAVVGFYGRVAASTEGPLAGVIPAALDSVADMKLPILGLFGGDDPGIPVATVTQFDEALDAGGPEHEIVVYPGAPHSFFDRKYEEHADACADAWRRLLDFLAGVGSRVG
jgi:carboxymethylenebutenolidase